jgi:hypothetical protein
MIRDEHFGGHLEGSNFFFAKLYDLGFCKSGTIYGNNCTTDDFTILRVRSCEKHYLGNFWMSLGNEKLRSFLPKERCPIPRAKFFLRPYLSIP